MIASKYYSLNRKGQLRIEADSNTLHTYIKSSLDTIYFNRELTIRLLLDFSNKVLKNLLALEDYNKIIKIRIKLLIEKNK